MNEAAANAQALSEEIQKASILRLRIKPGPAWLHVRAVTRFFAPQISPLRWPPIQWTTDESKALKLVTDEVLILDGRSLQLQSRIAVQHISQLSVSFVPSECHFATFSPAASSCGPAMMRVFSKVQSQPALTKGLFSSASWAARISRRFR